MNHVDLEPEERSLIAAARQAHAPSEMQRARVCKGLEAKLAAGVAVPLLAASTAMATVGKIGAGIAIVAVVTAGTAYVVVPRAHKPITVLAHHAAQPAAPAPAPVVPPQPVVPAQGLPVVEPSPIAAHRRDPVRRREVKPTPSGEVTGELAGELALLTQANAAIRLGDVTQANALLRTYDQHFPSGHLAEERAAAGILALCAAGHTQSAIAEARRFVEHWPRSPLVARLKASCAAEGRTP